MHQVGGMWRSRFLGAAEQAELNATDRPKEGGEIQGAIQDGVGSEQLEGWRCCGCCPLGGDARHGGPVSELCLGCVEFEMSGRCGRQPAVCGHGTQRLVPLGSVEES